LETLSIVIPVFNEVHTIAEIIERVREVHLPQVESREIVILDDYSTSSSLLPSAPDALLERVF
jgi:glycosyltransferase involved in cell wall biosynthesis